MKLSDSDSDRIGLRTSDSDSDSDSDFRGRIGLKDLLGSNSEH